MINLMPRVTRSAKGLTCPTEFATSVAGRRATNAKKYLKFLSIVTCQLSLIVLLSGCQAIGFSNPAALQVTAKPEASVFLDGKHIGKTPFFSDHLKEGEYTLKVTVSETSYVDKITLSEGTLTVVNRELASNYLAQSGENLSLVSGKDGLFIISLPSEADVTIDGSYSGKTPILTKDIEMGDHKIQLVKEGYVEREFAVKTSSKYQVLADVTLASQIAKGIGINSKEPPKLETERVLVLNTPQGFLKVRKDPSLSSEEIGRVTSGNEYKILQETKEWFQISFEGPSSPASQRGERAGEAGQSGWISAAYAQKVE